MRSRVRAWDYALAIIVWHEMAHLDGADEQTAQLREEALWEEFVAKRVVDADRGRRYLRLLSNRRIARPTIAPIGFRESGR